MATSLNDFTETAVAEQEPSVRDDADAEAVVEPGVPQGFRRLKWDEPVLEGDFVVHELSGFEPWEGPSGFRAASFIKPIYRRLKSAKTAAKTGKSK
jgi:hypothetical protein